MNRLSIQTEAQEFHTTGTASLFTVQAGLPIVDALEQASNLLECVRSLSLTVATEMGNGGEAFAAQYLAEMAKALIDACVSGAFQAEVNQ